MCTIVKAYLRILSAFGRQTLSMIKDTANVDRQDGRHCGLLVAASRPTAFSWPSVRSDDRQYGLLILRRAVNNLQKVKTDAVYDHCCWPLLM